LIEDEGLSLRAFAEAVDIPYQEVYAYENDGYLPSVYNAEKIALFFDCSFDYFFGVSNTFKQTTYKKVDISLFYPRYKELLEKEKVSHYNLHKTIKLNNSSITKWKNGSVPRIESLIKIATRFSTHIDYLVGRSDSRY